MNHSESALRASTRIVPPDSLLKFGYTPNGGIKFDSASSLLSFSYSGTPKVDVGAFGMNLRNGEGLVVGHDSQLTVSGIVAEFQVLGSGDADSTFAIGRQSAGASSGNILLYKSRNATIGSSTVVQSGDGLGNIGWFGDDGTDFNTPAAQIATEVDGTPGANDMPGRLLFKTTADGSASLAERMRIDSAGGVYIGETANAKMT